MTFHFNAWVRSYGTPRHRRYTIEPDFFFLLDGHYRVQQLLIVMASHANVTGPFSGYREDAPLQDSQESEVLEDGTDLYSVTSYDSQISTNIIGNLGEIAGYMQLNEGPQFNCVWKTLSRLTGTPYHELVNVPEMLHYHSNKGTTIPFLTQTLNKMCEPEAEEKPRWK